MSTLFNGKAERDRRNRDTPEKIVALAHRNGIFSVSLRYRDEWLRKRCVKLRKQGYLRGGYRVIAGHHYFYPTEIPYGQSPRHQEQLQGG